MSLQPLPSSRQQQVLAEAPAPSTPSARGRGFAPQRGRVFAGAFGPSRSGGERLQTDGARGLGERAPARPAAGHAGGAASASEIHQSAAARERLRDDTARKKGGVLEPLTRD